MHLILSKNKPLYDGLKVTREEYLDLEDDGYLYEMIDGILHWTPSGTFKHNRIMARLAERMKEFFEQFSKGRVVMRIDVFLPDGRDVLCPDITVILKENYDIIKGHIHGVPDIVVEVLSEATRRRDLGIKTERYLRNGVKEYWIADPDEKIISLWINPANPSKERFWEKKEGDKIESSVLPGLVIDKREIFPK